MPEAARPLSIINSPHQNPHNEKENNIPQLTRRKMKRKAQDENPDIPDKANGRADKKRRSSIDKTSRSAVEDHFRSGLFEKTVLQEYKSSYATSEP